MASIHLIGYFSESRPHTQAKRFSRPSLLSRSNLKRNANGCAPIWMRLRCFTGLMCSS